MIWHSTRRCVLPLKRKRVNIAKFLIAQYSWQPNGFNDGFDGIYVTQILRRKNTDIRRNALPDPFCIRPVLHIATQNHVVLVVFAYFTISQFIDLFDQRSKQSLGICEHFI